MSLQEEQRQLCQKYGASWSAAPAHLKVGIARNVGAGEMPINGLRHQPEGDTTGWYLWAGERSDDPDFFRPMHLSHLESLYPGVLKYLGLAPGWRFQCDESGYEDVWEDRSLAKTG
jgi:hypothetical protein